MSSYWMGFSVIDRNVGNTSMSTQYTHYKLSKIDLPVDHPTANQSVNQLLFLKCQSSSRGNSKHFAQSKDKATRVWMNGQVDPIDPDRKAAICF